MRRPVVMAKPGVIIEKSKLEELWNAANGHCVAVVGQYICESDGPPDDWDWEACDWNPPMPESPEEMIDMLTEYLIGSI